MATDAEIVRAVTAAGGNRAAAARKLGVDPTTIRTRIIARNLADKCPPPWHGGKEPLSPGGGPPLEGRLHAADECKQPVSEVDVLIGAVHAALVVMDSPTVLGHVVRILAALEATDDEDADVWTVERLEARAGELEGEFRQW